MHCGAQLCCHRKESTSRLYLERLNFSPHTTWEKPVGGAGGLMWLSSWPSSKTLLKGKRPTWKLVIFCIGCCVPEEAAFVFLLPKPLPITLYTFAAECHLSGPNFLCLKEAREPKGAFSLPFYSVGSCLATINTGGCRKSAGT
ncbi:Hypothetical predicted protein [Podarcis lilfordi]|uniref:Uncharacterized protein n=1 Tax=Podarcis lilfordi TaxID=74358 RepID=A0AA35KFW3_9SAUR|nr:Hypothetical predicted protein [Podarcis lilfordi]